MAKKVEGEAKRLPLISLEEALRRLPMMGRTTGYELARRGEFPGARRLGGRWFVSVPEFLEFFGLADD